MAAPFPPPGPSRRVPRLRRYYGPVRLPAPLSPRFVAFAWRYQALRLETTRSSQVPEASSCTFALFFDPGRTDAPGPTTSSARPPLCPQRRRPRPLFFRGSIARLQHALSTLRQVPRDTRRTTRFPRLATVRGGMGCPQDSAERFQRMLLTSRPPFSSFPGARTFLFWFDSNFSKNQ